MKKTLSLILTTLAALLLVTSCSLNKGGYVQNDSMSGAQGYPDYNERFEGSEKNEYYDQTDLNDRKIIKTVNETLQTDDFDQRAKARNRRTGLHQRHLHGVCRSDWINPLCI